MDVVIAIENPRRADVRELIGRHLDFASAATPICHVHALDVDRLADPAVTLVGARRDGVLLGVGALQRLDESHAELKSMHTAEAARGQGIGRAVLDHLLTLASDRGYRRVSLETGTIDAFGPARALYAAAGFTPCEPFGQYTENPHSAYLTIELAEAAVPVGKPQPDAI